MMVFTALVAATLVPLFFLTRATLALEPGAGPQGGEMLFAGWLMTAAWLTLVSLVSAVRVTRASPWVQQFLVAPAVTFVGVVLLFWLVFHLLNDSSLAEVPRGRAQIEVWLAAGLVAGLVVANVVALRRR